MKLSSNPLALSILAALVIGVAAACRGTKPLPPRHYVSSEQEALALSSAHTVAIAGTGSMKPYLPDGEDPREIVALAAVEHPPYEVLEKGDLVVYRNPKNQLVVHQIVARFGACWIASGINNRRYDGPVVNRDTFRSRVKCVYILPRSSRKNIRTLDAVFAAPSPTEELASRKPSLHLLKTRRASRPS